MLDNCAALSANKAALKKSEFIAFRPKQRPVLSHDSEVIKKLKLH